MKKKQYNLIIHAVPTTYKYLFLVALMITG